MQLFSRLTLKQIQVLSERGGTSGFNVSTITAMNIASEARKRALLLHLAGARFHDIYDVLADASDDYDATKTKLHGYFSPKKNTNTSCTSSRKPRSIQVGL